MWPERRVSACLRQDANEKTMDKHKHVAGAFCLVDLMRRAPLKGGETSKHLPVEAVARRSLRVGADH
jgi:hypothetical protein